MAESQTSRAALVHRQLPEMKLSNGRSTGNPETATQSDITPQQRFALKGTAVRKFKGSG
jgi:hypothetical protein